MSKRSRVVSAVALLVIGASAVITSFGARPQLNAAGLADTSFDLTKYLVFGGIGLLVISALLFISASAE